MIEDEEGFTDIRARRNFGAKIKEISSQYNPELSL